MKRALIVLLVLFALSLGAASAIPAGFFDGHKAEAASLDVVPATQVAKAAKSAPLKKASIRPACLLDPSGSRCMSCWYVSGQLRCYWTGIAVSKPTSTYSAVLPSGDISGYNLDPGGGGLWWNGPFFHTTGCFGGHRYYAYYDPEHYYYAGQTICIYPV